MIYGLLKGDNAGAREENLCEEREEEEGEGEWWEGEDDFDGEPSFMLQSWSELRNSVISVWGKRQK